MTSSKSKDTAYFREIQLPSKGFLYGGRVPDGIVHVEPMGTKQEKLFASGKQGSIVINKIFDDCLSCPIPHLELVLGDRLWILLNIRAVSCGSDYEVTFSCEECGSKGRTTVDLLRLQLVELPEDYSELFKVTLPLQGTEVTFRLLTGKDEDAVTRYKKQLERHSDGGAEEAAYVYRLARRILEVDGERIGIQDSMKFVETIKGADSIAFWEAIDAVEIGPIMEFNPCCNRCGFEGDPEALPIRAGFLRPVKRRRTFDGDYIRAAMVLDK